jgi:hypothetical protein
MHFEISPPIVPFAGNPIRYRINLDDGGGLPPPGINKSVVEITFSEKDTDVNHSLSVSFLGITRTFTLKTTPDDAYSLPSADSDELLTGWVSRFKEALQKNGEILRNYQLSLSEDGLTIILSAYGADASFNMSVVSNDITGLTLQTTTGGGGSTSYDGVAIMVLDKDGALLGEDIKPLNNTNKIDFEISEYLNSQFSDLTPPRFYLTTLNEVFIFSYVDLVKKYRVLAGYHVPGLVYVSLYDVYHWAIAGGLSREALVVWNQNGGGFWNDENNKKRFLSWQPTTKKTSRCSHESLYFFSQYSDVTRYKVMIKAFAANGDSQQFELANLACSVQYIVLELMVGYTQIDIESHINDQPVVRWKVWLEDQNERKISEERTFEIDEKFYEFPREFVFRNSFWVFDYFRFTGKIEKNLTHDRESIQVDRNELETYYNSSERQTKIVEQQTYKGSSGWISRQMLDYLRELMISPEIYEIINENPWRVNIITKKTSKYYKDGEYLYNVEIEYQRAYTDTLYSGQDGLSRPTLLPLTADNAVITADSNKVTADQTEY